MSEPELERRYRRLLVFYPWSHRRVYEEEMLAVLIAGAPPGRRRPTVPETAHLAVSGLRARVRAAAGGFAHPGWADAAAVVGLLAALVLLSQRADRLVESMMFVHGGTAQLELGLRTAGWAAVVLAALFGLRRSAAVLAWAITIGETVSLAAHYGGDPVSTVHLIWPQVLAVTAAIALTVPVARRRAVQALGGWRLIVFAAGLVLVHTILLVNAGYRARMAPGPEGGTVYVFYGLESGSELVLYLMMAAVAVGAVAAALAVLSLPSALRLRVAVLLAPTAAFAATVKLTLDGWSYSNMTMGHPIYLVPVQWALLVTVPLAALALGALLVQRREQAARLTALGRAADRERLEAGA